MAKLDKAAVVAILNPLYVAENTAKEQFHVQEHIYECSPACHYDQLADFFDCLVEKGRCRVRKLMDRVIELGSVPPSRFGTVNTSEDIRPGLQYALDCHNDLSDRYQEAIEEVEKLGDRYTLVKLIKAQCKVVKIAYLLEAMVAHSAELKGDYLLLCIKELKG